MNDEYEMDFIKTIKEAGLEPPNKILVDGRFHRFSSKGRPSDKPGWYILHDLPNCAVAGAFGAGERVSSSHGHPSKCQH